LPASPQIFHGRGSELNHLLDNLKQVSPRITILGAGGIGKTSLTIVALHHTDVVAVYPQRYFVQCQSVSTRSDLVSSLASNLEIGKSTDPLGSIIAHLEGVPSLLVLDNFETPWEFPGSQSEVEDLLSQLS
ncbi:hypothetical protein C8R43DRAFT_866019, partial [Mycena crocata]